MPLHRPLPPACLLLVLASAASALAVGACGSAGGARSPRGRGAADAGADAAARPGLATTPPPSGLPPMAAMPPPGVAGSKKAKKRADPALAACSSAARPQAKDPADHVKRTGEGCASTSKMKPASPILRGQQGDRDPHQEQKFRAEPGKCYRVYFAGEEAARDVVVVLRDSAGDIVTEAPGPAAPSDGAVCFAAADEVTVLVGIGSGKGAWAAQVWSD